MTAQQDLVARLGVALADRYAVEREIGHGGAATVFLALEKKHGRRVAIKVLRPEVTILVGAERFLQEIQIAARLGHPNILPLHDSGEAAGFLYYVMPYVEGESLRDRLKRERQLPVEDAVQIAREVADALWYAHRQGVVHRDIKPENILLSDGHAVVADFGIARSLNVASGSRGSTAAMALGTPAYMSPEQWAGDPDIDGRTDLYSVGCVLYEMLAGEPPFTGPTPHAIAARHRLEPPPPLHATRPTTPRDVAAITMRLLEKTPANRFPTAAELIEELQGTLGRSPVVRRRRHWLPAAILAGVLLLGFGLWRTLSQRTPLDPERYLVLPFRHRDSAASVLITGDVCEAEIYEALARWNDIRLVNSLVVRDAIERRGGVPSTLTEGLAVARRLGAGLLLWGELWEAGDTTLVRGVLYNVARKGEPIAERVIRLTAGGVGSAFTDLADSLAIGRRGHPAPPEAAPGTESLAALRAFGDAHAAMARWDLEGADQKLREAIAIDPRYPQANLRLAQVAQWQDQEAGRWRQFATASLAGRGLSSRDSAVALALLDLADGRYQDACARYRGLLARDSLDFAGWFGLGECQSRDTIVVRSRASPSGWSFRSSQWAAIESYRRALALVPSVHVAYQGAALIRLESLLYTEPAFYRAGRSLESDTLQFAAFPGLAHDTLAFIPYPARAVFTAEPATMPSTRDEALTRSRAIMRDIATTWLQAFPASVPALVLHVLVSERTGNLQSAAGRRDIPTPLEAARRLRSLAPSPDRRSAAGVMEVRLLFKAERFQAAATLADSLLEDAESASLESGRTLAGIAVLRGRVRLASRLAERSAPLWESVTPGGRRMELPEPVKATALRLLVYAALGVTGDSLDAARARVHSAIATYIAPSARPDAEAAVLVRPTILAFPALDTLVVTGDYLLDLQRALARGARDEAGRQLATIQAFRRTQRPGDVAIDATLAEARALLLHGDTAAASERMARTLDALPSLGSDLLNELPLAAAVVRAMALRADLAARAGDNATARHWAAVVTILWADADPEIQTTLARMREIARLR